MQCIICGSDKTKVINSRQTKGRVRRNRECNECLTRFITYEWADYHSLPAYFKNTDLYINKVKS